MSREEDFDFLQFLTHSLSLQLQENSPTRASHYKKAVNPYEHIYKLTPLEFLGEVEFVKQRSEPENVEGTPIQEFFRGAHVFITGGTGFIGKVLTEKLVRSVPHLGQIYLLIRAKRGKSVQERFQQLLEDPVFRRMKSEVPEYSSKLTAMEGDISSPGLGLSAEDKRVLQDHVTVVFHSAADVRFVEPLRAAVTSNVTASQSMLTLAKGMAKLKVYVHVSTAYSQCVKRVVPEEVPMMPIHYKDVLELLDSKTDEEIEQDLPRILHGWPNTYTFTKAMCEQMLVEEGQGLPICIFRPSSVVNSFKEPFRGWTDNIYGPIAIMLALSMGVLHCFRTEKDLALDTVPVDFSVNCLISSAWDSVVNRKRGAPTVYNYVAYPFNTGTWKGKLDFADTIADKFCIQKSIWYQSFFIISNSYLDVIGHFFLHTIPGLLVDKLLVWNGQKPRLTKIYKKLRSLGGLFRFFAERIWEFESENVATLLASMSEQDKAMFHFDMRDFDMCEHLLLSKLGTRYYFLKEKMETLLPAQRKNTVFYWLHVLLKSVFGLLFLKISVAAARLVPL